MRRPKNFEGIGQAESGRPAGRAIQEPVDNAVPFPNWQQVNSFLPQRTPRITELFLGFLIWNQGWSRRRSHLSGVNHITGLIITSAMKVHSLLGPGLLERAYQVCLTHELEKARVLGALDRSRITGCLRRGREVESAFASTFW